MTLHGYKLRDQVSITKMNIASPQRIHKCPKIGVWPNAINVVKHAMKRNERYSACNVRNGFQAFLNSYNFSFAIKKISFKKRDRFFIQQLIEVFFWLSWTSLFKTKHEIQN